MNAAKILLVYDSAYGTTAEVANVIADHMVNSGFSVCVQSANQARAPEADEKVILGSPIRYEKWMPALIHYIQKNEHALSQASVAYFYTCMAHASITDKDELNHGVYDQKLRLLSPKIKPIAIGGFAGVLNYRAMSFFIRLMMRLIARKQHIPEGDYRNWREIRHWCDTLAAAWHPTELS